MPLISLIVILAVVGFVLWLLLTFVPMPDPFKKAIVVIVVIVLIIWILQIFGITGPIVGRLR